MPPSNSLDRPIAQPDARRVRVGIIGTGVGLRTLLPGFAATEGAEVVGLVGSSPERTRTFARDHGLTPYDSALQLCETANIDLVCVASPNVRHHADVMCALDKGKHVLAEKPLAMTREQIVELIRASQGTTRLAIVDHQLRFNPYLRAIRDHLASGDIGRPYYLRLHQQGIGFSDTSAPWSWSFDAALGGGVRLAMASHLLDLVNFFVGPLEVHSVFGGMDAVIDRRQDSAGDKVDVLASSFFSCELAAANRLRVHLSATAAAFSEPRFDCEVFGTDGELRFGLSQKLWGSLRASRGKPAEIPVAGVFSDEAANRVSIFSGSFRYFAPLIIAAIRSGERAAVRDASSFPDALWTHVLLEAIRESSLTGASVSLKPGYTSSSLI